MRVLLVSDNYPPVPGGANRAVQMLAHRLRAEDHAVHVVTSWHPSLPGLSHDGKIPVHRVRDTSSHVRRFDPRYLYTPPPLPDPELVGRVSRVIADFHPNVVHAYGWLAYSAALACRNHPTIGFGLSLRDYGHLCAKRTLVHDDAPCSGPAPAKCMRCAVQHYGPATGSLGYIGVAFSRRLLARRIDGVHAISRFVLRVSEEYVLADVAPTVPRWVIPSFTDDLQDGPEDTTSNANSLRLPTEPYVLFVGSLRRVKGVDVLLDAYAQIPSPAPPLVLVGAHTRDTPTLPAGVLALGHIADRSELRAAWAGAMFGVAPSVWPEPLGNVVHEGMRAGKAVIGTHPGGHAEMIEHGATGLLVRGGRSEELADAMLQLIRDPDRCSAMGLAAAQAAQSLSPDSLWRRFQEFYGHLASPARSYVN